MSESHATPPPRRSARRLWIGLALVLLGLPALFYGVLFWRWHGTEPVVTFDPLAELNAPAMAVPEAERAWPALRAAWAAGGLKGLHLPEQTEDGSGWAVRRPDPAGFGGGFGGSLEPETVDLTAWLGEHAGLLEAGRAAAGFAGLGWLASRGPLPPEEVEALYGGVDPLVGVEPPADAAGRLVEGSAIAVLLPTLGPLRTHCKLLALDAHAAAEAGDAPRWLADLAGIEALARFATETPTLINDLVSLSLLSLHNEAVEEAALAAPQRLGEAALAEAADRLAAQQIHGLLRVVGERLAMRDLLQRTHAPGRGGHLTATGAEVLSRLYAAGSPAVHNWRGRFQRLADPLRLLSTAGRAETLAAYDRFLDAVAERLGQPLREAAGPDPAAIAGFDAEGFVERHPALPAAATSLDHLFRFQEVALARRDAARLAVALARFRLARGTWPEALDEFVPAYLDALPADRITGGPLRYAVRGGRPVVWSLGADRDDDGGVPAADGPDAAALWGAVAAAPPDGDWVLLHTLD